MINSLVVKLPYPRFQILGINISKKKDIGFLFTNQSIYNFRENNQINTSVEHIAWMKEHGDAQLITEMMYGAAQAYCQFNRLKQKFTKQGLTIAIASADPDIQKQIIDGWKRSQTFGAVESKKKTIKKSA